MTQTPFLDSYLQNKDKLSLIQEDVIWKKISDSYPNDFDDDPFSIHSITDTMIHIRYISDGFMARISLHLFKISVLSGILDPE